ncbi:MAG: CDP-alcohol phosphatidyltransferase family protein [Hyphomicrobiales bacterium]
MSGRLRAALVHVLTASGAVLALLALRAAHQSDWRMMFVWLGVTLFVDAIDGPLARRFDVKAVLPRFSGERLDLIVDYLTYVAIPAFVLTEADLLPEAARLPAAIAILLSGLFHVSDVDSKTDEGYFVGFQRSGTSCFCTFSCWDCRPSARSRRSQASCCSLSYPSCMCTHSAWKNCASRRRS